MTVVENHIDLTDISEKLRELWDKEQGEGKIRASLFSLILYVQKNERMDYYNSLVKSVVSKYPCRVIMIIANEESRESYLRTSVDSETIHEGELQIYCEIVRIDAAGHFMERVFYLILPHLLPDLPIYLLWTQDPSEESAVLPNLEPIANRIIFDAQSTKDLQSYCIAVQALLSRFHCAVSDLNWSAFSGWRTLFRHVFSTPDTILNLQKSKTIRIHYNKHFSKYQRKTESKGAYLQAWLASRLSWKFKKIEYSREGIRILYKGPSGEVVIWLIPEEIESLHSGAISFVEIESQRNQAYYSFKRNPQTRQVFLQYSDKERCDLPYCSYLIGIPEGQEILKEIFYPSTGEHYLGVLDVLSTIPWRKE